MNLNMNKAGMEKVDKERVQQIIAENTSGKYSAFSEKQKQRLERRQNEIKYVLGSSSDSQWRKAEKQMDLLLSRLESSRDLERDCIHVDMDAYFAAVEMRDEPRYRNIPMAVGSNSMLGTSNYQARKFGVRAAMPGFIAKKLCPQLEIVPGDYAKYTKESKIFAAVFEEYDCEMSMGSLDEAYIDITEFMKSRTQPKIWPRIRYGGDCICRLPLIAEDCSHCAKTVEICSKCGKQRLVYEDNVEFGITRAEVVRELRFRVEQTTGLTCSAGIATNFMLAKICSDMNKPNGQYELANEYYTIMEFLRTLSIRKVSGIGAVSEAHLAACEIFTAGDLLEKRSCLPLVFSELQQESLLRVALGVCGRSSGSSDSLRKSISVERTFPPTNDETILRELLQQICVELKKDVENSQIEGAKCVTVKLKLATFDVLTRSFTLPTYINSLEDICATSHNILTKELGQEIRLLGVRLSHFKWKFDQASGETFKCKRLIDYFNSAKRQKCDAKEDVVELGDKSTEPSTSLAADVNGQDNDIQKSDKTVNCPLCSCSLKNDDRTVNAHVDMCLNSSLVTQANPVDSRKRKISDFFSKDLIS